MGYVNQKSQANLAMAATIRAEQAAISKTQKQLAEMSGVNYETLKNVLNGSRDINITQIVGLAGAFGMTPEHLVELATQRLERMSSVAGTTDELDTKRKQREAAEMSGGELDATKQKAATNDDELDSPEPDAP